ncbi:16S rRNA (uracil(1498)-N(3))-methyltransferase [Thalassorhabdus alkalitolerans]|uniref:Ribosomal RNA small subunit methyltransferase E n=1 Tax=Thalassorhabdus alkalitolerans TaxID=2282697 RepID=A0ABW0YLW5_9BACI
MQRYFVNKEAVSDGVVTITGEDVKHISKVMRMEPGDQIICNDNDGFSARCELDELSKEKVTAKVLEQLNENHELPVNVHIAYGLSKGDKVEAVVQKGTELGASCFYPFAAQRSVVKWDDKKEPKKLERLEKIAKEAAEQSHRDYMPVVKGHHTFKEIIETGKQFAHKLLVYEETAKEGKHPVLFRALQEVKPGEALFVIIGPEGGISPREAEEAEKNGFLSVSLGPRIVRSETAPLYILSAISYHFEISR